MSKSKIKKSIVRGIQTKKFEQVTITVDIDEEIEWKSVEERNDKTKKITEMLLDDFKKTYNEVVNVLGVDRCIGAVEIQEDKKKDESSEDEIDMFDDM